MSSSLSAAKPLRVLVVDDEPNLCEILGFYLTDAGYDVIFAHSGNDARKLLEHESVDAIISDIRMPNGTGIELLDWIKVQTPHKPVVLFMTAHSDLSPEEAYHKGAEALLPKPVKPAALLEALQSALEGSQSRLRRYARVPVKLAIALLIETQTQSLVAQAYNLGRGGAFIVLGPEALPAVGSTVRIRIDFAHGSLAAIEGEGIVRWRRTTPKGPSFPTGIGVEFINLPEACLEALGAVIDASKVRPFIPMA